MNFIFNTMSNQVKVSIGGKEFTLRGENEFKIKHCAQEVDQQLKTLQGTLNDQSTQTLSLVAALNLAEQKFELQEHVYQAQNRLISEIEKMTAFINQSIQS